MEKDAFVITKSNYEQNKPVKWVENVYDLEVEAYCPYCNCLLYNVSIDDLSDITKVNDYLNEKKGNMRECPNCVRKIDWKHAEQVKPWGMMTMIKLKDLLRVIKADENDYYIDLHFCNKSKTSFVNNPAMLLDYEVLSIEISPYFDDYEERADVYITLDWESK